MAKRQTTFLLKRSNVPGKIPPTSGLTSGELALNTADAILYTSGSTANTILPIGWDRISRTGDTVTGNFTFFGDLNVSGSSLPNGYALSVTGDTNFVGDVYVTGDLTYNGSLLVTGGTVIQSGLTANTIYTNYIDFNTGVTVTNQVGRLQWDDGNGTLVLGLKGGISDMEIGLENMALCYNDESTTLTAGTIVYVSGSQGNRPSIKRAIATGDGYSVTTLGMVSESIASGSQGFVTTFGMVNNLNTVGLSGGTPIWLSPTVSGGYTSTKPQAPNHTVLLGYVVRVHASVGSIFIHTSNGWELDEIHDVRINNKEQGDLLILSAYNGSNIWVNTKTLNGSYTITGNTNISGTTTVGGDVITNSTLKSLNSAGDEGGEIFLNKSVTNTSINNGVTVDVYRNTFRIFESGGSNRGVYIDLTAASTGVGTNLLSGGGGEINTASNIGSGTGLFAQKVAADLQFKSLTSTGGTVTINNTSNSVNLEVVPASNFTGGTVNGGTNFTNGLTANTISATTYFNLPTDINVTGGTYSNGVSTFTNNTGGTFSVTGYNTGTTVGNGTANYLARWTGTTGLSNSIIRDDGTNIGVGMAPTTNNKFSIVTFSNNNYGLWVRNASNLTGSKGIYGSSDSGFGNQTGVWGVGQGHPTTGTSIGVDGGATDGLLGIGVRGIVGPSEFGSMVTGIGGYFDGRGIGDYGYPTNSYSVQLLDGTEGVGKFLVSITSDGKANWTNKLSASTFTITSTPTNNDSNTQVLSRNSTTGAIEYTNSSSIGGFNYGLAAAISSGNYLI